MKFLLTLVLLPLGPILNFVLEMSGDSGWYKSVGMVFEIKNGTSISSQYGFLLPSSPEVWLVTLFGGQGISPYVIYFQKLSDNV